MPAHGSIRLEEQAVSFWYASHVFDANMAMVWSHPASLYLARMSDNEDARWAGRLLGIRSPAAYADPAKADAFLVTKLLLEAGHQLREQRLDKGDGGTTHGLARLTKKRVTERAMQLRRLRNLPVSSKVRSFVGAFDDRWYIDGYRKDLVIFGLYHLGWREALEQSRHRMLELLGELKAGRLSGRDFIRAIVRQDADVRSTYMRYSVSDASLVMEPAYREMAVRAHLDFLAMHANDWIDAYREIQRRFGIELRPEVGLDKSFRWIAWLVQAAAVEATVTGVDTTDLAVDGILTVIAGMADTGDRRSPGDVVDDLFRF
jgi:hypothetical protein